MVRESFVFYKSFYEAIKELPRDVQGEVLTAIVEYGLYGETTEQLKPIARAMMSLIRPQIEANNIKFENGKKGGRPKQSESKNEAEENQQETEIKPSRNQTGTKPEPNVNVNVNVNDNVDDREAGEPPTSAAKRNFDDREAKFYESLVPFLPTYRKDMIRSFFDYWREPNKSRSKMRWEQERTWDLNLRLQRWSNNEESFGKKTDNAPADEAKKKHEEFQRLAEKQRQRTD